MNKDKHHLIIIDKVHRSILFPNISKLDFSEKFKDNFLSNTFASFDIETSKGNNGSYMYAFTFSIENIIYLGRTWEELFYIIDNLMKIFKLTKKKKLLIGIHNLDYEWQFIRKRLTPYDVKIFARGKRDIFYFELNECVRFIDTLKISGCSLEKTTKLYNLKLTKLKGDLDFSIQRSDKTKLTKKQWRYIIHDTQILIEFMHKLKQKYNYIPMTATGIVRKEIKTASKEYKSYLYSVRDTFPTDLQSYKMLMKYGYSGGIAQCNNLFINRIIDNSGCKDIKSSYPFEMLSKTYPIGKPIKKDYVQHDGYHYLMQIEFYNIRKNQKSPFNVISSHKLLSSENATIINGRVYSADKIKVYINEVDLEIINLVYDYTNKKITFCRAFKSAMLPGYVTGTMLKYYKVKEETPKGTDAYNIAKSVYVNNQYGCMVTRLATTELTYSNGEVLPDDTHIFDYEKEVKKSFLSPLWGIYVTSYARYHLIKIATKITSEYAIYTDTDSIYHKLNKNVDEIIREENDKVMNYNKNHLPEFCLKLGTFENEYTEPITRFKSLGAKRYIKEVNNKVYETIAGLPKGSLTKYAKQNNLDMFEAFQSGLFLDTYFTSKNTHFYYDEPHTDIIDGTQMYELSSMTIDPTTFEIKNRDFMDIEFFTNILENELNNKYDRGIL